MQRRLEDLQALCAARGILTHGEPPTGGSKWLKRDYVRALSEFSYNSLPETCQKWGLRKRIDLVSPMLYFSGFEKLSEKEREKILNSGDWVGERKIGGARVILTYEKEEGWSIFGREVDPETFLPVEFTHKVRMNMGGVFSIPTDVRECSWDRLILDGEMYFPNPPSIPLPEDKPYVNATEVAFEYPLERVVGFQKDSPLMFSITDLLEVGGRDCRGKLYVERRRAMEKVVGSLMTYPFIASSLHSRNLEHQFDDAKKEGYEGLLLKNLGGEYLDLGQRPRTHCIKWTKPLPESA